MGEDNRRVFSFGRTSLADQAKRDVSASKKGGEKNHLRARSPFAYTIKGRGEVTGLGCGGK